MTTGLVSTSAALSISPKQGRARALSSSHPSAQRPFLAAGGDSTRHADKSSSFLGRHHGANGAMASQLTFLLPRRYSRIMRYQSTHICLYRVWRQMWRPVVVFFASIARRSSAVRVVGFDSKYRYPGRAAVCLFKNGEFCPFRCFLVMGVGGHLCPRSSLRSSYSVLFSPVFILCGLLLLPRCMYDTAVVGSRLAWPGCFAPCLLWNASFWFHADTACWMFMRYQCYRALEPAWTGNSCICRLMCRPISHDAGFWLSVCSCYPVHSRSPRRILC